MPKFVFFVKDFIVGGVEQVLVSAVNALVENGSEVAVVWTGCLEKNHLYQQINPKVKQFDTDEIWHLVGKRKPSAPLQKFIYHLKKNLNLYRLRNIRKYIPEFDSYDYLIDFKNGSSKIYNIKTQPHQKKIVWLHGAFSRFWKKKKFAKYKLLSYDKIVCLTESFERQFKQAYPQYKDKICQIYNPFNLSLPSLDEKELGKALNYKPFFVHVSRIDSDKDILTAIKAYKKFAEKTNSSTKLVFIGDGKLKEYYAHLVQELGLADKIIFNGTSSCPAAWMKHAKALILCSFNEGLPTVLIEGQIAQTLVVASDCEDGPDEILQNGQSGLLFPVGDETKLAEILVDVDADNFDSQKYVASATKNLYRFGKDEFLKKIETL